MITQIEKKVLVIRVEMDLDKYKEARELCGLSHDEILNMIVEQGLTGLSNYTAHTENWVD